MQPTATDDLPDAVVDQTLEAAQQHLTRLFSVLRRLKRRDAELGGRQWALALHEGADQARSRLGSMRAARSDHPIPPEALVGDLLELAEALRERIWSPATREDLGAERDEAAARPGAPLLQEIDALSDAGLRLGDALFQLAIDLSPSHAERSTPMPSSPPPSAASSTSPGAAAAIGPVTPDFLYDLLSTLASGRGTPAVAATGDSNPVSARLRAMLDALGLPHRDTALGHDGREREARELLIESLRRNFAFREHDGVRSYYRLDRLPSAAASSAASGSPALRGLGLCQAETLRFRADLVLRLVDELPAMLPYQPRLTSYNAEALRERIRASLDDLVRLMSAPLGPTALQAQGQYRRLLLAIADWLEGGQIARRTGLRRAAADPDLGNGRLDFAARLRHRDILSPVASQEIAARVDALFEALEAIGTVVFDKGERDTGRDTAQLEQLLTLLGASALTLQAELATLGTSADEQEVAYFGSADRAVSIGQFARWAADLSAAFATGEDHAATLRTDELRILALELGGLAGLADALDRDVSGPTSLRLVGARRQTKELVQLIHDARRAVDQLLAGEDEDDDDKRTANTAA